MNWIYYIILKCLFQVLFRISISLRRQILDQLSFRTALCKILNNFNFISSNDYGRKGCSLAVLERYQKLIFLAALSNFSLRGRFFHKTITQLKEEMV